MSLELRVLVTAGGTREYIDGVRYIANFSSGRTGAVLAERLSARRCRVTLLRAHDACRPEPQQNGQLLQHEFVTFSDLEEQLRAALCREPFDAVIHAAAVSDYAIDRIAVGATEYAPGRAAKFDSSVPPVIYLKNNPKLLPQIKVWAREAFPGAGPLVIGFKLTNGASAAEQAAAAARLFAADFVDYVMHNDLEEISEERHAFQLFNAQKRVVACGSTKEEMADRLEALIVQSAGLPPRPD